jgi:hypothetical protein
MDKINAAYANAKKYSMDCEYLYFEDQAAAVPYSIIKGQIKKYNTINYIKQGDTETINTLDYSVRVENDSKTITLLPKKTMVTSTPALGVNIDSLSKFYDKVEFKKLSGTLYSYIFLMKKGWDYAKLELQFDKNTFLVKRMIFSFDEMDISDDDKEKKTRPRIEVVYSKFNASPNIQEKDINYERFLVKKGKSYELKPEFSKYTLYAY